MIDIEQELANALNREILVELLAEKGHKLSDADVDKLIRFCDYNPWDAIILYEIENLHIAK